MGAGVRWILSRSNKGHGIVWYMYVSSFSIVSYIKKVPVFPSFLTHRVFEMNYCECVIQKAPWKVIGILRDLGPIFSQYGPHV